MSARGLTLGAQREIIVCPDCGQVYDPAKAAALARVRSYSQYRGVREIKPQRVAAQDVRTSAHRAGRHHQAHVTATRLALSGWAPIASEHRLGEPIYAAAVAAGITTLHKIVDPTTQPGFALTEELPSFAVDLEGAQREFVERVVRAARAVREDPPWWRAYLHELGAEPEEIARGLVVNTTNRADLFFAHTRRAVVAGPAPTLRGLK